MEFSQGYMHARLIILENLSNRSHSLGAEIFRKETPPPPPLPTGLLTDRLPQLPRQHRDVDFSCRGVLLLSPPLEDLTYP